MATFVLIHGSYQGGWVWKPVSALLSAAGHAVYRPTLDGCAERKGGLRREITLATNGQEIANLLFYEDLQDVIFVGTSSGGMVVCQAAEQVPERIRRLIFIDALVPVPGETVATINGRAPYSRDELVYGPRPENARGQIFADLSPEVEEWALARYTRHPLAPTEDPVISRTSGRGPGRLTCCGAPVARSLQPRTSDAPPKNSAAHTPSSTPATIRCCPIRTRSPSTCWRAPERSLR